MKNPPGVVFLLMVLTALAAVIFSSGCISNEELSKILEQAIAESGTKPQSDGTGASSHSPSPQIIYFKAEPPEIGEGGTSLLKWKTENAESVSISGIGAVTPAGAGNISVRPGGSATYELTATNATGQFVKENAKILVMVPLKGDLPPGFTPPGPIIQPKAPNEIKPLQKIPQNLQLRRQKFEATPTIKIAPTIEEETVLPFTIFQR